MNVKIPRGTQDILPEQVKLWQWIEDKVKQSQKNIVMKKFVLRFLNIRKFSKGVSVIRLISFKKKCILSKIVVEETLH